MTRQSQEKQDQQSSEFWAKVVDANRHRTAEEIHAILTQDNGSLNGRIIQDHAGDPLPEPMPDDETPEEWTRRKQADERVQSQRDALEDPSAR